MKLYEVRSPNGYEYGKVFGPDAKTAFLRFFEGEGLDLPSFWVDPKTGVFASEYERGGPRDEWVVLPVRLAA